MDLIFTRDRAFYFTTVFIPGIILVTSSFITFWLEWNAVPARSMIGNMHELWKLWKVKILSSGKIVMHMSSRYYSKKFVTFIFRFLFLVFVNLIYLFMFSILKFGPCNQIGSFWWNILLNWNLTGKNAEKLILKKSSLKFWNKKFKLKSSMFKS